MWLSPTLKIATALPTEILERGRAHDAANQKAEVSLHAGRSGLRNFGHPV
jgi:hypothetical protein